MSLTETSLQLIQLSWSKSGSVSLLLGVFIIESEEILVMAVIELVIDVNTEFVVMKTVIWSEFIWLKRVFSVLIIVYTKTTSHLVDIWF